MSAGVEGKQPMGEGEFEGAESDREAQDGANRGGLGGVGPCMTRPLLPEKQEGEAGWRGMQTTEAEEDREPW